jgi:hypothetical protein
MQDATWFTFFLAAYALIAAFIASSTGMKSVYNLLWDSAGPKLADKIRASVPYTSDTSPGCKNFSDADLIQILGEFIKL